MDDFTHHSSAFMSWFTNIPQVTIHHSIQLADLRSHDAGRGLVALADIPANTDLFTLPRSCIISSETSALPKLLPASVFEDRDPWSALILVMIYEYLLGADSQWKPYFDVLPAEFDTLMFWSEDELAELQACAVRGKIGRQSADEMFKESVIPIIKQHEHHFYGEGSTSKLNDAELLALAHRFGSTIMAYAFDLEKDSSKVEADEEGYASEDEDASLPKGMVPLADLLNSNANYNARLFYGTDTVTMRAVEDIKQGEEILNDYGHLPRSDLLRRYGYITQQYKPFDVVEVTKELLVQVVREYRALREGDLEKRLEYLEDKDVLEDGYDIGRRGMAQQDQDDEESVTGDSKSASMFPPELLLLLRVLLAEQSEYKKLKSLSDDRSAALWVDIGNVLVEVGSRRMKQYATNAEEDSRLLEDESIQGRRRAAVEVRLGEKEILKEMWQEAVELKKKYESVIKDSRPAKRHRRA